MAWKGADSEGVTAVPSGDIKWAQWLRVARQFQLRVGLRDHRKEKFDGFAREVRASQVMEEDNADRSDRTTTNSRHC